MQFDFSYFTVASTYIYSVGFGAPIVLTMVLKCLNAQTNLFLNICIYGYSTVLMVPILCLLSIPVGVPF